MVYTKAKIWEKQGKYTGMHSVGLSEKMCDGEEGERQSMKLVKDETEEAKQGQLRAESESLFQMCVHVIASCLCSSSQTVGCSHVNVLFNMVDNTAL